MKILQATIGLIFATFVLASCGAKTVVPVGPQLTKIRYNMGWLPQGSQAGFFVAEAKGYYAADGLDVQMVRGFGGLRTVNELDQGMFEFGYGDPLAIAMNRAKGGHTLMVGAINGRWPAAVCYIKERHKIMVPKDMKGLRFGGGQASPIQTLMPKWLAQNGLAKNDVTMMQLDPAVIVASLIEGKIDMAECWLGNSIPLFEKRAKEAGLTLGWLPYADYGINLYGSGIMTTDQMALKHPAEVRAFLLATYRGYTYALAHPAEAVAIMRKAYPMLDANVTAQQLQQTGALMALTSPTGAMEAPHMQAAIDILGGDKGVRVEQLFSNAYLPARTQPEGGHHVPSKAP